MRIRSIDRCERRIILLILLLLALTKPSTCCESTTVRPANKIADLPSRRSARVLARNQEAMAVNLDAQQLQALVQAAVQAALTAVRPQAAVFAMAPGGGNAAWDFTSGNGLKLYISATKSLEEKFDG